MNKKNMKKLFMISGLVFATIFVFGINVENAEAKCKKGHVCYSDSGCGNFNIGSHHYGGDQQCAMLGQNCPTNSGGGGGGGGGGNGGGSGSAPVDVCAGVTTCGTCGNPACCPPVVPVVNQCDGTYKKVTDQCGAPITNCSITKGSKQICYSGLCMDPLIVPVVNLLVQNADKTIRGPVTISSFKIVPSTINPYSSTNPATTGNCNLQWTLNEYDTNTSTCTISGGKNIANPTFTPSGLSGNTTDTQVTNETTYKLTCGDKVSGVITGTSTKFATCYMNAGFNEVNPQ
ncbi:MAG: hypothetical protein WCV55_01675 [Candidatus Paceibacterota bacterium]